MNDPLSTFKFSRRDMIIALLNAISLALLLSSELLVSLAGFSWMLHLDEQITNALYIVSFLITALFLYRTARRAYRAEQKMAMEEQTTR